MSHARRARAAAGASVLWMFAVVGPVLAAATMELEQPRRDDPYFRSTDAGNVVVRGTVSSGNRDNRIEAVEFAFTPGLEASGPCRETFVNDPGEVTIASDELTATFELVISAPCNRSHEVAATVTYRDPLVLGIARPDPQTTGPVRFGVAVPPARVTGVKATYDPATKKVDLTWAPNGEPDLVGYRVERNPPGPDGFEPVGGVVDGTSLTDTLAVDEEHRYRVVAIRSGPDDRIREVVGEFSDIVTSGPDRPEPTVPDTSRPPSGSRAGSTAGNRSGSGGGTPQPRRGSATTIDSGFNRDLPFDPRQTTTVLAAPSPVPPEDAAVLAIDDDRAEEDDRRATLVPIAGGLALMMGAVHLRLLSKSAAAPELPVYGSTLPR